MKINLFKIIVFILIICMILLAGTLFFKYKEENPVDNLESLEGITVVPTMNDKLAKDSTWCGTMQLVWNDMKNEVIKEDIIFTPQIEMVENLNKEDFTEEDISEDYYYKIYGTKSLELKEQIENGIKEKFNQTSDVLNSIDWSEEDLDNPNNPNERKYFFYTMLYRQFEFLTPFKNLDSGNFGDNYENVEYFGLGSYPSERVRNQIDVLYYNSKDDFALIVNTKTDDEVIYCKNPKGSTFNEIYDNMLEKSDEYTGKKYLTSSDEFKAPNFSINEEREYTEFENKEFSTADNIYDTAVIEQAIQTINLSIDKNGGVIKSEAAISIGAYATALESEYDAPEPRYFYVDDTFTLFLREKGKEKPYFAARIDDITKFQ